MSRRVKFLGWCAVFILAFALQDEALAQARGGVKGVLKDAQTGEPLMYANVALVGTTSGTVTDEEGSYQLLNLKAG